MIGAFDGTFLGIIGASIFAYWFNGKFIDRAWENGEAERHLFLYTAIGVGAVMAIAYLCQIITFDQLAKLAFLLGASGGVMAQGEMRRVTRREQAEREALRQEAKR